MKEIIIRISDELCQEIIKDLSREHDFAIERVGFVIGKSKELIENKELVIITEYIPVDDDHYLNDHAVGARINSSAIRGAMQIAMDRKCSIFHIHMHYGIGTPSFSTTDLKELPGIAESLINANPNNVHGVILLNKDGINGFVKMKPSKGKVSLEKLVRVGYPMSYNETWFKSVKFDKKRYDRQSFLGKWSQHLLSKITVGVIGLGGGGSQIIQQLAHLGIFNYVIFDYDVVEDSNLNRLIGATVDDAKLKIKKTDIAHRQILGLQPKAKVQVVNKKWQEQPELLQFCDVIFGAVDSFATRRDIELECRRYLIPYIDIGMDVRTISPDPPRLYGQVILSLPGCPCMHCIGYLTEEIIAKEVAKYGDAGKKPQVVWANGVLASNAIGIFVDLVTGWSRNKRLVYFQEYDGNNVSLKKSYRLDYLVNGTCPHFSMKDAGPISWIK